MSVDCLFCRLQRGDIPARILYEDHGIVAFQDIAPQAPVHFLVIPRAHVTGVADATPAVVAGLVEVAVGLARDQGLPGYRLVINQGEQGGQSVGHLHVHVLGGRQLGWPPG